MKTQTKIIIVSVVLVALGGFYIYKNIKENSKSKLSNKPENEDVVSETTEIISIPQEAPNKPKVNFDKILKSGINGEEVRLLQIALKGGLDPDGKFGKLTEKRLKDITGKTSITLNEYNVIINNLKKK